MLVAGGLCLPEIVDSYGLRQSAWGRHNNRIATQVNDNRGAMSLVGSMSHCVSYGLSNHHLRQAWQVVAVEPCNHYITPNLRRDELGCACHLPM